MMELQLGLALYGNSTKGYNLDLNKGRSSQILDVQDENDVNVLQTLPLLLLWDKHNDDHQNNEHKR